jgi:hypothetical protein
MVTSDHAETEKSSSAPVFDGRLKGGSAGLVRVSEDLAFGRIRRLELRIDELQTFLAAVTGDDLAVVLVFEELRAWMRELERAYLLAAPWRTRLPALDRAVVRVAEHAAVVARNHPDRVVGREGGSVLPSRQTRPPRWRRV